MNEPPLILVVDDEALNRELLVRRLGSRGFATAEAVDGPSCLTKLIAAASGTAVAAAITTAGAARAPAGLSTPTADPANPTPFDLVLLDVNMPGMSGLDVLKEIRTRWSHDALPVILVTALGDADDVIGGLSAGANDYIVKPVNLPVLLARVRVALKIKHGVELLMEAERQRVMVETLGNACNQIAQPLTAVTVMLETLIRQPDGDPEEVRTDLREVLCWTREAGDLIHKLRNVCQTHTASYLERVEMLDRNVVKMRKDR